MRNIDPEKRLIKPFTNTRQELPTHLPVIQYIRQSTETQVKEHEDSTYMQDEELAERLYAIGFTEIIPIDDDQGISGQKLLDQRGGLNKAYRLIKNGQAGAIAAYDASRLWRDTTHTHYNDFINELIVPYNVPVLFADDYEPVRIFWPHRQQDMDALREEFKQSAYELRRIEKMNAAKKRAVQTRISYGGGCIPIGYIVETVKIPVGLKMKNRSYFVVYEPHAVLIRWLFARYRALEGSLSRLGQEVKATNFMFPAFQDVEKIPRVGLAFNGYGYPLRTRNALLSILTNPAYIGWYVFDSMIVSKEAHEPIVSMDDFLYAYNRLSPITLDGQPNVTKPVVTRRENARLGLLSGVLHSNGKNVYAMAQSKAYHVRNFNNGFNYDDFVMPIAPVDRAFESILLHMLYSLDWQYVDAIQETLFTQQQAQGETQDMLTNQLASVQKAIRKEEINKRVALEEEYEHGVRDAIKQLKTLHAQKSVLEMKLQQVTYEQAEIAECTALVTNTIDQWHTLPFESQKRIVNLLVHDINMREVTPHIVQLDVTLTIPLGWHFTGYVMRNTSSRQVWTDQDMQTLRRLHREDRAAILQALPTRTWAAIHRQMSTMGLKRGTHLNTSGIPDTLSYVDVAFLYTLGHDLSGGFYWDWNLADKTFHHVTLAPDVPVDRDALMRNTQTIVCYWENEQQKRDIPTDHNAVSQSG